MCRVSARRLSIYNFAWGLLKATKKVCLVPNKKEKTKKKKKKRKDGICRLNPKS
jgi:hypothetical protein